MGVSVIQEQMNKDKAKKIIRGTAIALGATYVVLDVIAKKHKADSTYKNDPDQQNPMQGKSVRFVTDENDKENADGKSGHLEATGESNALTRHKSVYEKYCKRAMDKALSFGGLVVLAPVMGTIALAIKIEDPGPVLFTQKRVGQDKQYFKLHKFRSMKMSTPHDVPTHMLENPEQYITKVGGFIRRHSLDELPQIWDIFVGNMSVIGPRPALWNQDVLVAERDKVGANDVKPGLTGWAQINGRDELSLSDKSALDGEYTRELEKGGLSAAKMDAKCFTGSIHVFGNDDTVVEGGTGTLEHSGEGALRPGVPSTDPEEHFACDHTFSVDHSSHKNVLIVGANSYIGEFFVAYAKQHYSDNFTFIVVDTMPGSSDGRSELDKLSAEELGNYDIVYHLAGIAHADVGNVDDATKEKYYKVNTDLAINTAKRYKSALEETGKKGLFVFMSSMIVYGDSAPYGKEKVVDRNTTPTPANFYGDSKWQADKGIRSLANETMRVAIIRPPMIYGKGSKGNYPTLAKLAKKLPVFPDVENKRSMLYIGNLCEFLSQMFLSNVCREDGLEAPQALIFMPQNGEFTKTSDMVKSIAKTVGHRISVVKALNTAVILADKVPGKVSGLVDKAFGNNVYDQELSRYEGLAYQKYSLKESIKNTEGEDLSQNCNQGDEVYENTDFLKYSVLMSVYKNDNQEYLIQAIESILNQTVPPEQYVIVIDGPVSDELITIINSYKEHYPSLFTILPLSQNGGLGNALNHGIDICRNELIARMDADDVSKPDRCEKELAAFKADPTLSIVGTQIDEFINTTDNVVSSRMVPTTFEGILEFSRRRSPFNHPSVMYRKSSLISEGKYKAYGRKEDLDLFIRMIHDDCKAINLPEHLLFYRTSEDNLKRRKTWMNCKEYIEIMMKFHKKGYNSLMDMAYVTIGQLAMYLMPNSATKKISGKYLRKKMRNEI